MWSEVLAVYAAVVSTGSVTITYISHRSGGPQLSGDAEIHGRYDIDGPKLFVAIHNRGRGPITIDSVMLWGVGLTGVEKNRPIVGWPLHSLESELPVRVEGNSGALWASSAQAAAKEWLERNDLARLEVHIGLATGKGMELTVDTSNIDVLRGRELPEWEQEH
jgi:hypothetical protein